DSQLPLRCRTQFLIRDLPATTGNLARLRDAAIRDLAWIVDSFADSYKVDVSMPALNRVALRIDISIGDQTYTFIFDEHWAKCQRRLFRKAATPSSHRLRARSPPLSPCCR